MTKAFAVRIYIICFIPVCIISLVSLVLANRALGTTLPEADLNVSTTSAISLEIYGTHALEFKLCHLILINLFPMLLGCFFYLRILYVVRHTAQTIENVIAHRKRSPSKLITASVLILLSSTVLIWSVYIICTVVYLSNTFTDYLFMYLKIIIFMLYPVGEGLFLNSAKSNSSDAESMLTTGRKTRISPVFDETSEMDAEQHPGLKRVVGVTISDTDDSNISQCCSSNSSLSVFMREVIPSAKADAQVTEPQPSTSREFSEETRSSNKRQSLKTRSSLDDIEEGVVDCEPSRLSALFHRRGSAFSSYKTVAQDSPIRKKKKQRHTVEKRNRKRSSIRGPHPSVLSLGRRTSISVPQLSSFQPPDQIFSDNLFENRSESPDLFGQPGSGSSAPLEGYSGLQYAKRSEVENIHNENEDSNQIHTPYRRTTSLNNLWYKVFSSVRKARSLSKEIKQENVKHCEQNNDTEQLQGINPYKPLNRRLKSDGTSSLPPIHSPAHKNSPASGTKIRSISCVNNVYSGYPSVTSEKDNKTKQRNKSVSFVSSVFVHDIDERSEKRSIEIGSKLKFKIRKESLQDSDDPNRGSTSGLGKTLNRKKSHWMLDKSTPMHECIEKLHEINEYF